MIGAAVTIVLCGLLSLWLTGTYRRYALRKEIVDRPNHRSSHTEDTARGAGLIIVAVYALVFVETFFSGALSFMGQSEWPGSGSVRWRYAVWFLLPIYIGLVGLADDVYDLGILSRIFAYAFGLLTGVAFFYVDLSGSLLQAMNLATIASLLLLFIVGLWVINLYNFMDGINGIAGFESIFLFSALLWLSADTAIDPLLLASIGAIAGFLYWNFPAAKVFMGDSGSTMLGALVFCAALFFWQRELVHWAAVCILPAVFVADASYTLARRLLSGQQWYSAHRSHSYQILARRWSSHSYVVYAMTLVNVLWLLPLAWLANNATVHPVLLLGAAYLPLLVIAVGLGAGRPERHRVTPEIGE